MWLPGHRLVLGFGHSSSSSSSSTVCVTSLWRGKGERERESGGVSTREEWREGCTGSTHCLGRTVFSRDWGLGEGGGMALGGGATGGGAASQRRGRGEG